MKISQLPTSGLLLIPSEFLFSQVLELPDFFFFAWFFQYLPCLLFFSFFICMQWNYSCFLHSPWCVQAQGSHWNSWFWVLQGILLLYMVAKPFAHLHSLADPVSFSLPDRHVCCLLLLVKDYFSKWFYLFIYLLHWVLIHTHPCSFVCMGYKTVWSYIFYLSEGLERDDLGGIQNTKIISIFRCLNNTWSLTACFLTTNP